jgi:hypothetical protein
MARGMTMMRVRSWTRLALAVMLLMIGAALVAPRSASAEQTILRVPQDFATPQEAIDAASPGDMILIDKGTYEGGVEVPADKAGITIRGVDRNEVIFFGDDNPDVPNAITVFANGVTMENMTAHNFVGNGFYWRSVEDYHGRYLTAWNFGDYGIYAFDSRGGVFEHSYASGAADAAFYIGQCNPCDAVIRNITAEHSALGYSGTNAGGNLIIEDSVWANNGAGIVPNSLDSQANPPQRGTTIRNNTVTGNSNLNTPARGLTGAINGLGIGLAGGSDNVVEGNTVTDHSKYGIVIFPLPDETVWMPEGNVTRGNTVSESGLADLALSTGAGEGNCFEDNDFTLSDPPQIEQTYGCDASLADAPSGGSPTVAAVLAADFLQDQLGLTSRPSYTEMPAPPPQENMPGAGSETDDTGGTTNPPLPATGVGLTALLGGTLLLASAVGINRRRD